MSRCYIYVVDRDFGFAPNPFHGRCTLATCKPGIRQRAMTSDWVIGMGGARLKVNSHCIYAMRVTEILSFDQYWNDPRFRDKRPVRNGSSAMLVGDNIYHHDTESTWHQADSHHSNPDGSPNLHNLTHDTQVDRVLVSEHFFYFGVHAPRVSSRILKRVGYANARNYRVFDSEAAGPLLEWLQTHYRDSLNQVMGDPFDFERSTARYSAYDNRIR